MDDLAFADETLTRHGALEADWMVLVEDRAHPIRKTTGLPRRWLENLPAYTRTSSATAHDGPPGPERREGCV